MVKEVGICEYCRQPIYENEPYRKLPLRKNKYVHKRCEDLMRAKAFAMGAWLRSW
jgi:biotin synthase-like enzyme